MTDKLTEMVEKLRESLVAIIASGQQRGLRPSQIAAEILADDVVAAALLEARVSPQADLRERLETLVFATGALIVATDEMEPIRKERLAALSAIDEAVAALSNSVSPQAGEDAVEKALAETHNDRAELADALTQISELSGEGYDSDRAWALAMQLRARVALQGWLGTP